MKTKISKIAATLCLGLIFSVFSVSVLFSQTKTGTLKIFSEITNTTIYLDEVKQDDGTKVVNDIPVGSHYLKVMSNGVAVYSEIIEIKNGRKCSGKTKSGEPIFQKVKNVPVKDSVKKNPNHWVNSTRNILLPNGQIRKVHIRLIIEFNHQKVCY